MNKLWLPSGHHWDLHILHMEDRNAGPMTGGGRKLVPHTTESDRTKVDLMVDVVDRKDAAPHVVYGMRDGSRHPYAIQMVPFNMAARTLQNDPSDGKQTNRANAWQVEICGFAASSGEWPLSYYKGLANLLTLMRHRVAFPLTAPNYAVQRRLTDAEWVEAEGIWGHMFCPDNDHGDPGKKFRAKLLIQLMKDIPEGGYAL